MKWVVVILCVMFLMMVHRHARPGYIVALIAVLYVFGLTGCATIERSTDSPSVTQHALTCGDLPHDGSYLLTRCTP